MFIFVYIHWYGRARMQVNFDIVRVLSPIISAAKGWNARANCHVLSLKWLLLSHTMYVQYIVFSVSGEGYLLFIYMYEHALTSTTVQSLYWVDDLSWIYFFRFIEVRENLTFSHAIGYHWQKLCAFFTASKFLDYICGDWHLERFPERTLDCLIYMLQ